MPSFKEMFSRLKQVCNSPPELWAQNREGCKLGIIERTFPDEYENTDSLSDHFCEPERILCKEERKITPMEAWHQILRGVKYGKQLPSEIREQRELVYKISRGCNLFNASLAVYLLKRFGNNKNNGMRILDCTAGWGDRLISAFVNGASFYRGWDTNPALASVYSEIAKACINSCGANPMDWKIECAPFESQAVRIRFEPKGDLYEAFDVAFVCPPYFSQELYNGSETSTTLHKTNKEWLDDFYIPMLKEACNGLKSGGFLLGYVRPGDLESEAHKVLDSKMDYVGALGFRQIVDYHHLHQPQQKFSKQKPASIRSTYIWKKK